MHAVCGAARKEAGRIDLFLVVKRRGLVMANRPCGHPTEGQVVNTLLLSLMLLLLLH